MRTRWFVLGFMIGLGIGVAVMALLYGIEVKR